MSTPAEKVAATPGDDGQAGDSKDLTFEQKINQTLDSAEIDEKGNIILPEDLPEDIKFAARSEKRRRDTQSALAKSNSRLAVVEKEKEGLTALVHKRKRVEITPEEQEELDELKHSDPDAWRAKMNALEQNANVTLNTELTEISESATTEATVGERQVLLEAFQHDNPGLVINDDVLANDVPPRILKPLETGEISFIKFLENVKEYLESGKVIQTEELHGDPNLSNLGGSDTPGKTAEEQSDVVAYEKAIF